MEEETFDFSPQNEATCSFINTSMGPPNPFFSYGGSHSFEGSYKTEYTYDGYYQDHESLLGVCLGNYLGRPSRRYGIRYNDLGNRTGIGFYEDDSDNEQGYGNNFYEIFYKPQRPTNHSSKQHQLRNGGYSSNQSLHNVEESMDRNWGSHQIYEESKIHGHKEKPQDIGETIQHYRRHNDAGEYDIRKFYDSEETINHDSDQGHEENQEYYQSQKFADAVGFNSHGVRRLYDEACKVKKPSNLTKRAASGGSRNMSQEDLSGRHLVQVQSPLKKLLPSPSMQLPSSPLNFSSPSIARIAAKTVNPEARYQCSKCFRGYAKEGYYTSHIGRCQGVGLPFIRRRRARQNLTRPNTDIPRT